MYMTKSVGVSCGCESDVWESTERDRNVCEFYVREMNVYKPVCVSEDLRVQGSQQERSETYMRDHAFW